MNSVTIEKIDNGFLIRLPLVHGMSSQRFFPTIEEALGFVRGFFDELAGR